MKNVNTYFLSLIDIQSLINVIIFILLNDRSFYLYCNLIFQHKQFIIFLLCDMMYQEVNE